MVGWDRRGWALCRISSIWGRERLRPVAGAIAAAGNAFADGRVHRARGRVRVEFDLVGLRDERAEAGRRLPVVHQQPPVQQLDARLHVEYAADALLQDQVRGHPELHAERQRVRLAGGAVLAQRIPQVDPLVMAIDGAINRRVCVLVALDQPKVFRLAREAEILANLPRKREQTFALE